MKILIVNKFLYPKGGAETYTLKIGEELKKRGNEVQYFGMYDEKNVVGNELNLYTKNMDFHTNKIKRLIYPFKIIYSFEAKRKIKKLIKNFRPDIIHLNNINFQLTPSIIDEAYKMNIPIVQTVHDYQMICPNHFLYNIKNKEICERCIHGSKWNCTKYNCIHNSKIKSLLGSIEAILYTKILRSYDKVQLYICPSKFLESKLLEIDRYKGKTLSLCNFIELNNLKIDDNKEDYILYFGRLAEEKGLLELIEAMKEIKNIKLKVAGTGPLEEKCKGIKNIEFVGFKTGNELKELIAKARFVVYPSIWYENCPLSVLEAESYGTPVVTGNYGGMKELVENGKTGILLEKINSDSIEKAIVNLYNNVEINKKMSLNCLIKSKEFMNINKYVDILLEHYNKIKITNIYNLKSRNKK